MFIYEKKLQFPVRIKTPNPKLASFIISQYGGPYGNRVRSHMPKRIAQTSRRGVNPVLSVE